MRRGLSLFLVVLISVSLGTGVFADDYTSTNFKVADPVVYPGGYSSSTNFQIFDVITQIAPGSSSATNFQVGSGFLYFPFATTPTVTATAGSGQVALSWTASTGFLGWTVSSYNVGQSTTSGGPYTYTSLGNVTSKTVSSLTAGTTYYFVIRPEDAFGNSIATSSEVSATPTAVVVTPPTTPPTPGGGGPPGFVQPPRPPYIPAGVSEKVRTCLEMADFNQDGTIGLIDFSIILFYFNKPATQITKHDINGDGVVDIVDVSVLFYCWS